MREGWQRQRPHGCPYALIEWLSGERLEQCLPALELARSVELGREVGRVLAAVHRLEFSSSGILGPDLNVY